MASRKRSNSGAASSSSSSKRRPTLTRQGTIVVNTSGYPAMGFPNSNFHSSSYMRARAGEPKYFDCGISHAVTAAGTTWADTEVACDNFVDSNGSPAAYTGACLVPTANGSGYGQVDGTQYMLKKIRVRGSIMRSAALGDQADIQPPLTIRCMLVMDTMPNGSQAQGEDIMQDIGEFGENLYSFMRVAATAGKFRVLKDETWDLPVLAAATDGTNTSSQNCGQANFNWKWQPKVPLRVNIKAGTGTTPSVSGTINCNIFMLVFAMQNAAVVQVTVRAASRCYYSD